MSNTGAIANDKTRIKNMALVLMGLSEVGVDGGIDTERGRTIEAIWEEAWICALEKDKWNFATRRVPLTFYAGSDLDPNAENDCQYHKPHDYVRGYGLGNKGNLCCRAEEHVNFRIVNSRLILERCARSMDCCCSCVADHDTIYYISSEISVAETSATFRQYLAYEMAILLHRRWRADDRSLALLEAKSMRLLKEAKDLDRVERNTAKAQETKQCHGNLNAFNRNKRGFL